MPKPLFLKLAALIAVGFFCVLFGCIIGIQTRDQILCYLSFAVGLCCVFRCIAFYRIIHSKSYFILEGCCTKKESAHFKRAQNIYFTDSSQNEYVFNLGKNIKILPEHTYRLYLEKDTSVIEPPLSAPPHLLGFEEIYRDICNSKTEVL